MPACGTLPQLARSNSDVCVPISPNCCTPHNGLSPLSPSSPLSTSPKSSAPISTLRRSLSSTFSLIPEEEIELCDDFVPQKHGLVFRTLTWFPHLLIDSFKSVINAAFQPAWGQMLVVLPTLWIAAWLWIFWKSMQCPLDLLRWCLVTLPTRSDKYPKQRTVLISCGSTIQALHLARNLHCSGAKVISFEIEGHFSLTKFSAAVDKFYTIAKPSTENPNGYIQALCNIVEKEKVNYYVPVCASSSAYFDALAKPHLEALGCSCFVPGLKEVTILDDIAEFMHRCQEMTKPTPLYTSVTSKEQVDKWYDDNTIPHNKKYFMASTGLLGIRERIKFIMPASKKEFRLNHEMSQKKPWVVVQDLRGEHFLTCTTVKESKVLANVTCKIDPKNRGLTHEYNKEIEVWLRQFFNKLPSQKPITGHVSLRFVKDAVTGIILPLGAKVGISLPYICHTSVHPRLLWKSCPHFNRQNSTQIGNYWMQETFSSTFRHPGLEAVTELIGKVLDKREALFAYWDPLPYCAYYQMQLPFSNVLDYIQRRNQRDNVWSGESSYLSPSYKLMTAH